MSKSTPASSVLDRVLVLEMVRVTEAAAIAASALVGRGDEKAADHAGWKRCAPRSTNLKSTAPW
jgi:fructose-1,6-bisphosphatase/sedoheptulose 1,7-bisphosphatase-like protein